MLDSQAITLFTRTVSRVCSCQLLSKQTTLPAGYKWVLLKEGQEPAPRDAAPSSSERAEAANSSGSGAGSGGGEPGYLAGAGLEGGLGRGPEADRLRDMLRHRDDQLASLQDQLRQLESTRDRWGVLGLCVRSIGPGLAPLCNACSAALISRHASAGRLLKI